MTRRLLVAPLIAFALIALLPLDAAAQGRRGPSRGPEPQRGPVIVVGPWGPYGGPWGWGWPYPYPYPYPGQYRYYYRDDAADLRIQATPRETEVYVDGARAGIVDDYDGIFQRLHLTPGEHEITLYLPGYRTWSERRYFGPYSNQKILHTMLTLAPGQPDEPRPMPPPPPPDYREPGDRREPPMGMPGMPGQPGQPRRPDAPPQPPTPPQPPEPRQPAEPRQPGEPRQPDTPRAFGTLSVGFQPADAEVLLDGQRQSVPPGQDRLVIQLTEGVHHLVIRKPGFEPFETDLQIRRGRTLAFNVSLVK